MSSGSGMGGGGGYGAYSGTAQQIEGQNDERLSGLLGKVKSLKDVSLPFSMLNGPDQDE